MYLLLLIFFTQLSNSQQVILIQEQAIQTTGKNIFFGTRPPLFSQTLKLLKSRTLSGNQQKIAESIKVDESWTNDSTVLDPTTTLIRTKQRSTNKNIIFTSLPYNRTTEVYTKNATCISVSPRGTMQGQDLIFIMVKRNKRISRDNYLPENNTWLYNCTNFNKCFPVNLTSMTELTAPNLILKSCFTENHTLCEIIRFNDLSKDDKVLFLSKTIKGKSFYYVNCLVNPNGTQECETIDDVVTKLDDKSNEAVVRVQEEFICEETEATNDEQYHVGTPWRNQLEANLMWRRELKSNHPWRRRFRKKRKTKTPQVTQSTKMDIPNPCDDPYVQKYINCSRLVCVSWQMMIIPCSEILGIPDPPPGITPYTVYFPKPRTKPVSTNTTPNNTMCNNTTTKKTTTNKTTTNKPTTNKTTTNKTTTNKTTTNKPTLIPKSFLIPPLNLRQSILFKINGHVI